MKCDRAVNLLATGGVLGRWLARRHAAHCPSCAAEADRLERIARELSAVQPLSAAQRALWSSMSGEPRPTARYRPVPLPAAAMAAVFAIAVVIGVTIVTRRPSMPGPTIRDPGPSVARPPEVPRQAPPDAIRELDDLKSRFQALSRDVAGLRRKAELLDERRDAEALSHRVHQTVALNVP
jgi:hypothetical protein